MLRKLMMRVVKDVGTQTQSPWVRYYMHRHWKRLSRPCSRNQYDDPINACHGQTNTSVLHASIRFHSRRIMNFRGKEKLKAFCSDIEARLEDFVLNEETYDIIWKEIVDECGGTSIGIDYTIMSSMRDKPDLSLSFMNYLQKNYEVGTSAKMKFCVNCIGKYEDRVSECIRELKESNMLDYSIGFQKTFLATLAKTREWRLCIDHMAVTDGCIEQVFPHVLCSALKYKDYQTFFEIWNKFSPLIMQFGYVVGTAFFESWEKGYFPLDILFEVSKLGEVPFSKSQADKMLEYCRNNDVGHGEYAEVSSFKNTCSCCRSKIPAYGPIDDTKFAELKKEVLDKIVFRGSIYKSSHPEEFQNFMQFMQRQKRPFDLVVDALNVNPYTSYRKYNNTSYDFLKTLNREGWNILMVTKYSNNTTVEQWKSFAQVFKTDRDSQDDVYLILGAVLTGPHCYILSNDRLRDHFTLTDATLRGYFDKWLERRKILHENKSRKLTWPHSFQWTCHETDYSWHIPYMKYLPEMVEKDISPELIKRRSKAFLCVKKKNYTTSDECKHFRTVKDSVLRSDGLKTIL